MDEFYLNAELSRLAVAAAPEFGYKYIPAYDPNVGSLGLKGTVIVDGDMYNWKYVNPNVSKPEVRAKWDMSAQSGGTAPKEIQQRTWDAFMRDELPDIIMDMSSKRHQFPRKFLERIPKLRNQLDMMKTDPLPVEELRELIEWADWVKGPNSNSREGVFTYEDPKSKEKFRYPFKYEEKFEKLPGGKWHYTSSKLKWEGTPWKIPKRVRENYLRMIKGEIAKGATEQAVQQGVMEPAEDMMPEQQAIPPMPEAEEPEAGGADDMEVTFTSGWKFDDSGWPFVIGQIGGLEFTVAVYEKDKAKAKAHQLVVGWQSDPDAKDKVAYEGAIKKAVLELAKKKTQGAAAK